MNQPGTGVALGSGMVAVPSSTTRTRTSTPRTEETIVRKPKTVAKTVTADAKPSATPTRGVVADSAAAPARRPTATSSAETRRIQLANPSLGALRTRLEGDITPARAFDGRLDTRTLDTRTLGPRTLGTSTGTTTRGLDGTSGRRISVDDPLARFAADPSSIRDGDAPRGLPGHPSMRRVGKDPQDPTNQSRSGGVGGGAAQAGNLLGRGNRTPTDPNPQGPTGPSGLPGWIDEVIPKPEGFSENTDGSYTFNGGRGDDRYSVTEGTDGKITVTNGTTGEEYFLTAEQAANGVTIDAGAGDDRLTIDESVRTPLAIEGGSGDDRIDGSKAQGALQIDGGSGDDRLTGGAGADALSGGSGDDRITGGAGNDQLLGQDGDDRLLGGEGDDYVQGGGGADHLDAGKGGDAVYADALDTNIDLGKDGDVDALTAEEGAVTAENATGIDGQFHYDAAEVEAYLEDHPELVIDGSDDFAERTRADIGVMLGTEQGRGLLGEITAKLQEKGETLTFREKALEDGAGGTYSSGENVVTTGSWAERYSDGSNRIPLPATFHELVHAYQDLVTGFPEGQSTFPGGGSVNNLERQATGLPYMDAEGNLHPANELPYTDNRFREELGLPQRTTYGGETGDPTGYMADDGKGGHDHEH